MSTIYDALKHAYASVAIVPIIPFFIVFFFMRARTGARKMAIRKAMDVTPVFLITTVAVLINNRFGGSFGLYLILLIMLILAGLIGNAQNRARGTVDAAKLFRAVWRLSFFGMSVLYVLLMFVEVIVIFGKAANS